MQTDILLILLQIVCLNMQFYKSAIHLQYYILQCIWNNIDHIYIVKQNNMFILPSAQLGPRQTHFAWTHGMLMDNSSIHYSEFMNSIFCIDHIHMSNEQKLL